MNGIKLPSSAFDSPTYGRDGSFTLDKPVGSASISPCGRDIVLASRYGLDIIDLDSPYAPPRHLAHHTPWEVADVQWSPFAARDYWIVSTSNQKALVWNLGIVDSRSSVEHVLHGHKRAITDINFSAHYPDVLATCAIDAYVHCWDLRRPARPAITFCDWSAGATQVKWNRQNAHLLASAHDKYLKIWDDRKGAHPLHSIAAHSTKIYGIDWNRLDSMSIATCSLDRSIKIWDLQNPEDVPRKTMQTPFPVWRARHTPFGHGILALPQRGDYDLYLYKRDIAEPGEQGNATPAYKFSGHRDQVKEFLWRPRGTVTNVLDDREFQLVSWGTDRLLRLHAVSSEILERVGYKKGMRIERAYNFTRRNAHYRTFRDVHEIKCIAELESQDGPVSQAPVSHGMSIPRSMYVSGYGSSGFMSAVSKTEPDMAKDLDPLTWMQGVKLGKKVISPSKLEQEVPGDGPDSRMSPSWVVFDSLGEEITASLAKFPRVKVDHIDVQQRNLVLSTIGPWSDSKSPLQIACRYEFPPGYPENAAIVVTLVRKFPLSDSIGRVIEADVNRLAQAYLSHGRSCLEAILRYLLGDQGLDQSLALLQKEQRSTFAEADVVPDSSSDDGDIDAEDDEEVAQYGQATRDLTASMSEIQHTVPLRRSCGAMWSHNGRLVCFFLDNDSVSSTIMVQTMLANCGQRSDLRGLFQDFGNLELRLSGKQKIESAADTDAGHNVNDMIAQYSPSISSTSSINEYMQIDHHLPAMPWLNMTLDPLRGSAYGPSQASVEDVGHIVQVGVEAKARIAFHDLEWLLPVKKVLGERYDILGSSESAVHNADIAKELQMTEITETWSLAALLMERTVEVSQQPIAAGKSQYAIVSQGSLKLSRPEIERSLDRTEGGKSTTSYGIRRVRWANHPFGHRNLISMMLHHFEERRDIQTLAMLTHTLADSPGNCSEAVGDARDDDQDISIKGQSTTRSRSGYFASLAVAQTILQETQTRGTDTNERLQTKSNASNIGKPAKSQLADPTPMSIWAPAQKLQRERLQSRDSISSSLSASPEQTRRNGGRDTAFSMGSTPFSVPRAFHSSDADKWAPSVSPHDKLPSRTRPSPTGSLLSPQSTISTWGTKWYRRISELSETSNFSTSSTASTSTLEAQRLTMSPSSVPAESVRRRSQHKGRPRMIVTLKNQDKFPMEGYASASLLDLSRAEEYRVWQANYIDHLHAWGYHTAERKMQSLDWAF